MAASKGKRPPNCPRREGIAKIGFRGDSWGELEGIGFGELAEVVVAEVGPFVVGAGGAVDGEGGLSFVEEHFHQDIIGIQGAGLAVEDYLDVSGHRY